MEVTIRHANVQDNPFIIESWLEYYKVFSQFGKSVPAKVYFKEHRKLIVKVMEFSKCFVACDKKDTGLIIGFICSESMPSTGRDVLHFIFVRKDFRKLGIGKQLLDKVTEHPNVEFTHQGDLKSLWGNYASKVYNPYLFLGANQNEAY